jgi:hypothetical protein
MVAPRWTVGGRIARMMHSNTPTVRPNLPVIELVEPNIMGTDERACPMLESERLAGLVAWKRRARHRAANGMPLR